MDIFANIEFIYGALGAVIGFFISHLLEKHRAHLRARLERTLSFIDQFYSQEFIYHRVSLWVMREKVLNGELSMRFISNGFIYPFSGDSYEGDESAGLSDHLHLTMYLGFISRLAIAITNNSVILDELRSAIRSEVRWHADFLRRFAVVTKNITQEKQGIELDYTDHISTVLLNLNLEENSDELNESHDNFPENNYSQNQAEHSTE